MIDQTITTGNLIEIATILLGGITVFLSLKGTVGQLSGDVVELKADIKALNKVVITMAVADQRITVAEKDIRELRHGRGFVRESLEREWPGISKVTG